MITVALNENLESFIDDAVKSGRYYDASGVISDALIRLRRAIDPSAESLDRTPGSATPAKKLTKQEFQRHLVKIGLLDEPPESDSSAPDQRELVDDAGEIVDEVVIRERLIEWLTGFLE